MTREDDEEDMSDYFDGDDCNDYPDDHGLDCDCEQCDEERAERECGELPERLGGGCTMTGTEHCDFDCPFRDRVFGLTEDDDE